MTLDRFAQLFVDRTEPINIWIDEEEEEPMEPRTFMRILVHTAYVDGVLHSEELGLLRAIAARLKMSSQQFQFIVEGRGQNLSSEELPKTSQEAEILLNDMAKVVVADQHIHPSERRLLSNVGALFGLGESHVSTLLDREFSALTTPVIPPASKVNESSQPTQSPVSENNPPQLSDEDLSLLRGIARNLRILGIFSVLAVFATGLISGLSLLSIAYQGTRGLIWCLYVVVVFCMLIGITLRQFAAAKEFNKSATPGFGRGPILPALQKLNGVFVIQISLCLLGLVIKAVDILWK